MKKEYYAFTFGSNHYDKNGWTLANRYVKLEGGALEARQKIWEVRDAKFASQYDWDEFIPQIDQFNLKEISLEEI